MTTLALILIGAIVLIQLGFLFLIIPKIDIAGPRWAIRLVRVCGAIVYTTGVTAFSVVWWRVFQGDAPWWASIELVIIFGLHVLGYLVGGATMAYFASPKVYDPKLYEGVLERRIEELERQKTREDS